MRITAFNGSPHGEAGNTNLMVTAFLEGAKTAGAEAENIFLATKEINYCKACRQCIASGKGTCVIEDDMEELMTKFIDSDIVILATPLFIDNISGMTKLFMDRFFSIGNPQWDKDENGESRGSKPKRYKNGIPPKLVVMSNCGYPERTNFQVISLLMNRFTRQFHIDLLAEIYASEGLLFALSKFGFKDFDPIVDNYRQLLHKAGQEIVKDMQLSAETQNLLDQPLIPIENYIQLTNKLAELASQPKNNG